MKKLLRFALVMVAALTMNISFAQTNLTEAVDFTVTDTEGHTHNLFDILASGQHVLIDFFFTN
jgi:cytochrome oxidase Cu insertion factor (SCO1/SenC/PrrC family)